MSLKYRLLGIPKTIDDYIHKLRKQKIHYVSVKLSFKEWPIFNEVYIESAAGKFKVDTSKQIANTGMLFYTTVRETALRKEGLVEALDIAKKLENIGCGVLIDYDKTYKIAERIEELEKKLTEEKKAYPGVSGK